MTDSRLPADLYRVKEAAQLLGLATGTLYKRFRAGKLTFYGWHRAYYVSLAEVLPPVRKPLRDDKVKGNRTRRARAGSAKAETPGRREVG